MYPTHQLTCGCIYTVPRSEIKTVFIALYDSVTCSLGRHAWGSGGAFQVEQGKGAGQGRDQLTPVSGTHSACPLPKIDDSSARSRLWRLIATTTINPPFHQHPLLATTLIDASPTATTPPSIVTVLLRIPPPLSTPNMLDKALGSAVDLARTFSPLSTLPEGGDATVTMLTITCARRASRRRNRP